MSILNNFFKVTKTKVAVAIGLVLITRVIISLPKLLWKNLVALETGEVIIKGLSKLGFCSKDKLGFPYIKFENQYTKGLISFHIN